MPVSHLERHAAAFAAGRKKLFPSEKSRAMSKANFHTPTQLKPQAITSGAVKIPTMEVAITT